MLTSTAPLYINGFASEDFIFCLLLMAKGHPRNQKHLRETDKPDQDKSFRLICHRETYEVKNAIPWLNEVETPAQ